jgi:hypothetical protein
MSYCGGIQAAQVGTQNVTFSNFFSVRKQMPKIALTENEFC